MSESESFIDEVTEELRRDRLFALMRKWGWIPVLVIIAIVGGTAYVEWQKATETSAAQAEGDALLAALESSDRSAALDGLNTTGDLAAVIELLKAAEAVSADDPKAVAEILSPVADDASLPREWRELAGLKLVMLGNDAVEPERRAALLDELATPGAPFAPLAREQQVYSMIEAGETEAALEAARSLLEEAGLTQGLQQRLSQVIVALGGELQKG